MKVVIITFHNAFNYGATLQCAALAEKLRDRGFEVSVIDYLPEYVENKKSIFRYLKDVKKAKNKLKALGKGVAYVRYANEVRRRNNAFDRFVQKHMSLTRKYSDVKELVSNPPSADTYICGSDQVWNRAITDNRFDKAFFLTFVKSGKKIAYAVSLGETKPSEVKEELSDLTEGFRFISVREEDMAKELGTYLSRDVSTVVDPTLLLREADYRAFEEPVDLSSEKYVLVYNVQNSDISLKTAETIAKKKGLEIIDISPNPFVKIKRSRKKISYGPGEFLTLIKHAEYIVTNSFHGTVFSIIYKKQFFTIPHKKRSGRMVNLLELLDLKSRIVESMPFDGIDDKIDYDEVTSKIEEASEESEKLLIEAIKG